MKKFTKILVAFMSFSLIACNNQTSNVSSNEESSSTIVDNSSQNEASSTISESSTSSEESSSSVEESSSSSEESSSSVEESSSSTEESSSSTEDSSSIEDSSSEEIHYDNAFMVGYGSYVKDSKNWNDEGGVKLDLVNDTPDALEKYVTTIDLKAGDVFMMHLLSSPDRWYGTKNIKNVVAKDYDGKFFENEGDNNIRTLIEGNYTIYFTVWKNYSAEIWIDVNSYTLPEIKIDDAYIVGTGSYLTGESAWSNDTGIKLTYKNDDAPTALEKYVTTATFKKDDVMAFHLMSSEEKWYNYNQILDSCSAKGNNFIKVSDSDDNIKVNISGKYTIYFTVWKDYSAEIWIDVIETYEDEKFDDAYMVGYGSYLTKEGSYSIDSGIKLTLSNDNPDALEKYVVTVSLKKDDVFVFCLKGDEDRWYNFDFINNDCEAKGKYFQVLSDTSKDIKVLEDGTYTIYFTIWKNYSADIWINKN